MVVQSKLEYIFCIGWFEGWGYPAEGSADTVCPEKIGHDCRRILARNLWFYPDYRGRLTRIITSIVMQGGRGHWAVYYTSFQSLIMMLSYCLP